MSRPGWILRSFFGLVLLTGLLLVAWWFEFSQQPEPPATLLEQSYNLSRQLNSFDRTYFLVTLLYNSNGIVARERYEQWCDELFRSASQLAPGLSRVAEEKNAIIFLSQVDPVQAMQHFDRIEDPQPDLDGTFPEDVRGNGARTVFANYWNSASDVLSRLKLVPAIEGEARRLGHTGEYPYLAMGFVIEQLAKAPTADTQKNINNIFSEALQFYKDGAHKFLNRNRLFKRFLEATKDKVSDRNLVEQAVHVFVEKVLQSPKDMDFQGEVQNKKTKEVVWVTDDRIYLLFEAFPVIHELAPKLADELIQKYPDFKKASKDYKEDMIFFPAGYGPPGEKSAQAQLMHGKFLQASIAREIKKNVDANDLQNAQILAARLTDDTSHIEGYTALLPALMKSAPEEAKSAYRGERTRLQEIRDRYDHLRAVVALAKASYDVHDPDGFSQLTLDALKEGTILFEEDSRQRPQWTPSERQGFNDLSEIVTFGVGHGLKLLPDWIQQIEDVELKANLLVFEARGMEDAKKTTTNH